MLLTSNLKEITDIKPDVLISIGRQSGDYPFFLAFSRNDLNGIEHWRICDDGAVVDTYDKLTRIYQGSSVEFFNNVNSECSNHSYFNNWVKKYNVDRYANS